MSLVDAILEESEALIATRKAAGALDPTSGRYVPGSTSQVSFYGSLQPMTQREALLLPEGIRQRASWKLYTPTELQITDPTTQALADQIDKNGITYEVSSIGNWDTHGGFYKYVLLKVEE